METNTTEFWRYREALTTVNSTLWYSDRIVIPASLRSRILENLHSAHQCVSSMNARAMATVFWPGITHDIEQAHEKCRQCHVNAPSQARLPPRDIPATPKLPFEMIFSDYFQLHAFHYLIAGDRLSGWTEVVQVRPGTHSAGAKGLCTALRRLFSTFGVPVEISSDGGPEYEAKVFKDFLDRWGVRHRESSAYLPTSNGRAEVGVKTTKRLLQCNVGTDGNLDTDEVVRALLQLRNTPDRDAKVSPAEVLFGCPLRDTMPYINRSLSVHENPLIDNKWRQAWQAKEDALHLRHSRNSVTMAEHSKSLPPLHVACKVFIQNQDKSSKHFKKWNRTGTIKEVRDFDQYVISVHGTGRLALRNRQFLKVCQDDDCTNPMDHATNPNVRSNFRNILHSAKPSSVIESADAPSVDSHQPRSSSSTPLNKTPIETPSIETPPIETPSIETPTSSPQIDSQQAMERPCVDLMQPSQSVDHDGVRRSTRVRTQTQFYDAKDGTYGSANV